MNILVADDERLAREGIRDMLLEFYPDADISCFERSDDAIEAARKTEFSIACLDVQMEPYDGIKTAEQIMSLRPRCNIIFTTGFDSFTGEAMALHASGYILKPVTKKKLEKELSFLRYEVLTVRKNRLRAHCLGNFEFFIDDKPVTFAYSKTKELLAYLIDRQGAVCTNSEISTVLGEDTEDGVLGYSYFNGIRRDLIKVFDDAGFSDIVVRSRGGMGLDISDIDCDFYDLMKGSAEAKASYNGEYMTQYSWAELTNGELWRKYGE